MKVKRKNAIYLPQHHILLSLTNKTDWNKASVDIRTQERFSIGLEAVMGSNYLTHMAVDDIYFMECASSKFYLLLRINIENGFWQYEKRY